MTIAINSDLTSPARLTAGASIDLSDAIDVIDLVDLLWPEAVELDVANTTRISADAVTVLANGLRGARAGGQEIVIAHAQPLVRLFLTITGVLDIDDEELVVEHAA
jgi:anti-anti-sigma regulatory factor